MEALATVLESGQKCTASGMWKVLGDLTTTQPMTLGQKMPQYCGKKAVWIFLYAC